MNNSITRLMIASSLIALASGCAQTHLSRDFGVADKHNADTQTINPTAYNKNVELTLSGEKAQKVIDGYLKEKPASTNQSLLKNVGSNN